MTGAVVCGLVVSHKSAPSPICDFHHQISQRGRFAGKAVLPFSFLGCIQQNVMVTWSVWCSACVIWLAN